MFAGPPPPHPTPLFVVFVFVFAQNLKMILWLPIWLLAAEVTADFVDDRRAWQYLRLDFAFIRNNHHYQPVRNVACFESCLPLSHVLTHPLFVAIKVLMQQREK